MTSFFVKGCRSQLHWLVYCLQLLVKNWRTPETEIVCMLDEDCRDVIATWGVPNIHYLYVQPWGNPYMHALWCKACADYWTRGDPIIMLDCDTLLVEPAGLNEYMVTDEKGFTKILLPYLEWKDRGDDGGAQKLWTKVFRESTGLDLDKDYMVSRPWVFARSTYAGARGLVEDYKNQPFYSAVWSNTSYDWTEYAKHPFTFCDLENLGYYAAKFQTGTYWVRDLAAWKDRKDHFKDLWSHTEFTPRLQSELDDLLLA